MVTPVAPDPDGRPGPVRVAGGGQAHRDPARSLTPGDLWRVHCEETRFLRPRVMAARLLLAPLPSFVGSRMRVAVLRALGFTLGRGTVMWGLPEFSGKPDLHRLLVVGECCRFNTGCVLDLSARISIGDHVGLGHQVMLLTTSHELGGEGRRSSHPVAAPIIIETGCWLGARATVLPGVTVGAGTVVGAGAVVTRDVPPNSFVAGVPARVVRELAT